MPALSALALDTGAQELERIRGMEALAQLGSRKAVDTLGAFLEKNDLPVADPPDSYNGDEKYYAVFFHDPDGMRLEAMHYGPEKKRKQAKKSKKKR